MEPFKGPVTEKTYKLCLAKIVVDENGCWIWQGATLGKGYGKLGASGYYWLAHRFIYTYHYGPIPRWMVVRHKCDVKLCVNPEHLEIGRPVDNVYDQIERGRLKPRYGKCKPIEYYRDTK